MEADPFNKTYGVKQLIERFNYLIINLLIRMIIRKKTLFKFTYGRYFRL
jgi:hypothetical protein